MGEKKGGWDLIQTVPAGSGPFFFYLFVFVLFSFFPAPLRDPPPFSHGRMGGELAQLLKYSGKDQRGTTYWLPPRLCVSLQGLREEGGGAGSGGGGANRLQPC